MATGGIAPAQPKPTPTTLSVSPSPTTTLKPAQAPQPEIKSVQAKPATTPTTAIQAASGEYWIQTNSFSKKNGAYAERDLFISKHFSVEIKEINNAYKVRIGPYPSKTEAMNMLSSIRSLKGYEKAWITQ
ncbi:MAG: SPOR domain-containing protein [Spirochaetes bacterium]|nr:SPOR domain-containing protein [Spirochaetota bacterium]